jgi:hypothetical protein
MPGFAIMYLRLLSKHTLSASGQSMFMHTRAARRRIVLLKYYTYIQAEMEKNGYIGINV